MLAALLAVLAVPPARTAILDWLGIGAARIVRVDELPSLAPEPGLEILGDRVSIDGAAARAGFPFARPPRDEPSPDEIRVAPGIRVSYVWRDGDRVRLLITQFPGSVDDPGLLKKLVGESTRVEQLEVDGHPAVWLEGGPTSSTSSRRTGAFATTRGGSPGTRCWSIGTASPSVSRERSAATTRSTSSARCADRPRPARPS